MASMRSNIASMRNCSGSMPPSSLIIEFRKKAGGDELVLRGIGQQIAGDLLDDELVVGQIAVERADDPIAIGPDEPRLVLFVAVRIGIPSAIEPDAAPALAVVRRGEQARRRFFVRLSLGVLRRRLSSSSAAGRSGRASDGGGASSCRPAAKARSPSSRAGRE